MSPLALWLPCEGSGGGAELKRRRALVNAPVLRMNRPAVYPGSPFLVFGQVINLYAPTFASMKWVWRHYSYGMVVKIEWGNPTEDWMLRGASVMTPPIGRVPRRREEVHLWEFHVAETWGPGEVWESRGAPAVGRDWKQDPPLNAICFQDRVWLPPGGRGMWHESHSHPRRLPTGLSPAWPAFCSVVLPDHQKDICTSDPWWVQRLSWFSQSSRSPFQVQDQSLQLPTHLDTYEVSLALT